MIIWLASYPKSGNTWLRAILHQIFIKKNKNEKSWLSNLHKLVESYPKTKHFQNLNSLLIKNSDFLNKNEIVKNWDKSQKRLNSDKKLRILKTHNMLCSININQQNHSFTSQDNTLGVIHVVRDPRNVITSLKNFYELKDDQAFEWITNKKQYIYDIHKFEIDGFSDFQFISSWDTNFESWKTQKKNSDKNN